MKLKVRVEIELAASLDLYLNVTGMIITMHWLSVETKCAGSRQEVHLLGGKDSQQLLWVFLTGVC